MTNQRGWRQPQQQSSLSHRPAHVAGRCGCRRPQAVQQGPPSCRRAHAHGHTFFTGSIIVFVQVPDWVKEEAERRRAAGIAGDASGDSLKVRAQQQTGCRLCLDGRLLALASGDALRLCGCAAMHGIHAAADQSCFAASLGPPLASGVRICPPPATLTPAQQLELQPCMYASS